MTYDDLMMSLQIYGAIFLPVFFVMWYLYWSIGRD